MTRCLQARRLVCRANICGRTPLTSWPDVGRAMAASIYILIAALVLVVSASIVGPSYAQTAKDLPPNIQALIVAAKSEGGLTVFGQTVNPDQERAFAKAVSDFYGFDIKLRLVSGLHPQKVAEVIQATKQGVPSGLDVFWTSATGGGDLDNAGALARIDWEKDFGVEKKLLFGPYGLRAQDGMLIAVAHNKSLVPDAQAPRKYEDVLNPMYRGRIAIPRAPGIFVFLSYYWGEERTAAYVRDLIEKQQARLLPTFPDVRTRLMSGEFAVSLGADVFQEQRKGAPVDHSPIDPIIVTPWASHVMKDAKSPNLAKLWSYWLTTDTGQKSMDDIRGISRVDAPDTGLSRLAQGKKIVLVPADWTQKESERLTRAFGKIMDLGR